MYNMEWAKGIPGWPVAYHFQRKRRTLGCCRRPRLSSGRFHRGDRGRHPKAQEEPKAQAKAVRHGGGGGGGGTDDDGDGDGLSYVCRGGGGTNGSHSDLTTSCVWCR